MSVQSKSAIPSLFTMTSTFVVRTWCVFILFQFPKQNVELKKPADYSPSSGSLKQLGSQMSTKSCLFVVQTGVTVSNMFQKLDVGKGFEMCVVANQSKKGDVLITFNLKNSEEQHEVNKNTKKVCGIAFVKSANPLVKDLEYMCANPSVLHPIVRKMSPELKKLMYSKYVLDLGEKSTFPTAISGKEEPSDLDQHEERLSMKMNKICFVCKERMDRKKFFDERRFGIFENCNCMICYGCVRKSSGTSKRVVDRTITCPSCSVKSNAVASSGHWIESEDKPNFFQSFNLSKVKVSSTNWLDSCSDLKSLQYKKGMWMNGQRTMVPVN